MFKTLSFHSRGHRFNPKLRFWQAVAKNIFFYLDFKVLHIIIWFATFSMGYSYSEWTIQHTEPWFICYEILGPLGLKSLFLWHGRLPTGEFRLHNPLTLGFPPLFSYCWISLLAVLIINLCLPPPALLNCAWVIRRQEVHAHIPSRTEMWPNNSWMKQTTYPRPSTETQQDHTRNCFYNRSYSAL